MCIGETTLNINIKFFELFRNINEADENGTIPLHVALRNKNFSRVLILLDHEAGIGKVLSYGLSLKYLTSDNY